MVPACRSRLPPKSGQLWRQSSNLRQFRRQSYGDAPVSSEGPHRVLSGLPSLCPLSSDSLSLLIVYYF